MSLVLSSKATGSGQKMTKTKIALKNAYMWDLEGHG